MADPLSAILVVANVLALTDNFYRGVQFVRKVAQDPKVDGMFVRLITEKARYAEWKRRMGVETPEDFKTLITLLPADARESLPRILAPIEKYVGVAERLFVKYGISAPDATDVNRTLKDKMRRLNLLMDGQQQVHDILETLKNCNDGLLTIAPPAPGYYVSLAGNDPILETADQASDVLEGPQTRWQPAISTSDGREGSMSSDAQCIIPPSPIQEPSRRVFHSVIELLHSTCLRVLRSIAERYPDHRTRFQEAGDRLQIWGTGLFHGQISIDQALNQKSAAVKLLRNNIAGTLADIAEVIRYTLSCLGESDHSATTLQLREIFSIPEISRLPLGKHYADEEGGEFQKEAPDVQLCYEEIADLTECLFCTLSTTEMVMREAIARQKHNQVTEERDLVLLDSKSDISLSGIQLAPAKELLRIDLELIAAMQESLKDSKFAKHMEHKNRKFDAVQLYKELGDEARQVKYWTDQLAGSGYNQNLTAETKSAMMLNLTNIARTFETGFKTGKVSKDLDRDLKSATAQFLKDFPELEQEVSLTGRNDFDAIDQINMLKSSNIELKRLAGANAPERRYTKDFALSEKAKLATAEDAADTSALSI